MKLNKKLSRQLSRKIKAENTWCYSNSLEAMVDELRDAIYVEGFAVDDDEIFSHGWLELNGEIIDVTPIWSGKRNVRYFAGIKYSFLEVAVLVQIKEYYPFVSWDNQNGKTFPEYMQALRDATGYLDCNLDNYNIEEVIETIQEGCPFAPERWPIKMDIGTLFSAEKRSEKRF